MTAHALTVTGTLSSDGKSASRTGSDRIVWSAVRNSFNCGILEKHGLCIVTDQEKHGIANDN